MIDLSHQSLQLEYPCDWTYKIIGTCDKQIANAVWDIVSQKEHSLQLSNTSKKGKFLSFNLKVLVQSEEERQGIYKMLSEHKNIMRVL